MLHHLGFRCVAVLATKKCQVSVVFDDHRILAENKGLDNFHQELPAVLQKLVQLHFLENWGISPMKQHQDIAVVVPGLLRFGLEDLDQLDGCFRDGKLRYLSFIHHTIFLQQLRPAADNLRHNFLQKILDPIHLLRVLV